ncbi:MAG: radical SAM protein [Candidatus Staskawiczbacteria bacterium]
MIDNFLAQRSFVGFWRRWKYKRRGHTVPSNIYLSPTYRCNLRCNGCYATCHEQRNELSTDEIRMVAEEQEQFGALHIVVLGGEPFLREDLWQIYEEFPTTVFDVFTNGTLLGEKEIARIAELGNVRIFISLEGFRQTTDRRRGDGVYKKVMNALQLCQEAKIYFCVSVTVSQENFDEVTSEEFVRMLNGFGVFAINYVPYIACGENPGAFCELSDEQVAKLGEWGEHIQDRYPIFPVIGRGGSGIVTACPAADSKIHITADGDIEPCVFCHFAADNIRSTTILAAMNSPFFKEVRLLNRTGISRFNPCKVGKSAFLAEEYVLTGAHPTTRPV